MILSSCVNQPQYRDLEEYWSFAELYDFAYLVCISQTYRQEGRIGPADRLDEEIWQYIEQGVYPARAYGQVKTASRHFAARIPSGDANVGCARWKNSDELTTVIRRSMA
ncbi:hypothetical protein NFC81_01160 [Salinispirillum sp. LH 10-3-1]|uniref:Uncharacterized protein n=1 Tax=Salinispirillum sp. LH 10-3-1 TaxID=2952525 RepID=A0AB38YGJ2_9GAMM